MFAHFNSLPYLFKNLNMYNLLLEVAFKNAGLVENSVDANETPHSVVSSGSTLFDQARLSEYIR